MAVTLPTRQATSWTHSVAQHVPILMDSIVELTKIKQPTLDILWANKKYEPVDNEHEFSLNVNYGGQDPRYGNRNMVFNTVVDPKSTRLTFTPNIMYVGSSVSDIDLRTIYKDGVQLMKEMDKRHNDCNTGLTWGLAYELMAPAGYTTTETELGAEKITLDNILSDVQTEITIKDVPGVTGRIGSLASIIKPHGAGHTYGGFSSANKMWQSHVYHNDGFTAIDTTNYTTYCASAPSDNVDLVTTMSTTSKWNMENIDNWLETIQRGAGFELLICCPPRIYASIGRYLHASDFGSQDNPLKDLGVDASFKHPAFSAIFYADPMAAMVWPNTLWAYDPELTYLAAVEDVCPLIYEWSRIEGSTTVVFAKIIYLALVCVNRRSTGALHGVTA